MPRRTQAARSSPSMSATILGFASYISMRISANKNFTVADAIFRPPDDTQVEFDAIYNARLDPRKRHALASAIERVAYLAYSYRSTGG